MYCEIDVRLRHLTSEQLKELIARYYAGDGANSLVKEFNIDCSSNQLYRLFPPLTLYQMPCPYCGTAMVRDRAPRSSSQYVNNYIRCPSCQHKDDVNCQCANCALEVANSIAREQTRRKQKVAELCRQFDSDPVYIRVVDELSLRQAVSLLALVRTCLHMNIPNTQQGEAREIHLHALIQSTMRLAPGNELELHLLEDLMSRGLIGYSQYSDPNAFLSKEDKFQGVNHELVSWMVRGDNIQQIIRDIERYAADITVWPTSWKDEVKELWLDIAFAEAKEFFLHMARQRGFPDVSGKALDEMILNLLRDLAVAQCYRVIYAGSRDAADFLVRKKCNTRHAANYMIGACQRWADHARAEKWMIGKYKRNFDLPRSMVSYVFFDTFLKIGETGFDENPESSSYVL